MIELEDVVEEYGSHRASDALRLSVLGPNGAGVATTVALGFPRPLNSEA